MALQLAVRAVPLAGLSLLIVPLPWTLPRLMALQATLPIAVLEGALILLSGAVQFLQAPTDCEYA